MTEEPQSSEKKMIESPEEIDAVESEISESSESGDEDDLTEDSMENLPDDENKHSERPGEEEQESGMTTRIFALRTTANREDQVLSFVSSNAARKKIPVHAVIRPHGMRGYIFLEADDAISAEQAASGVPYAKGVIPKEIDYKEIEHMLEQVKKEIKIQKNDIVEIIAGPFKREQAKITRVDKQKEEAVVELLEAAVPIPITLKLDDVKVIRREEE